MSSLAREARRCKALEDGFSIPLGSSIKIDDYNALHDPNMRHYFENRGLQSLLYSTGQIDKHGRVIDPDKSKSKISVLEREFKSAQRVESRRQQEEMDMRNRIQKKRFDELEKIRRDEAVVRLKQSRELGKEIIATMRLTMGSDSRTGTTPNTAGSGNMGASGSSFFKNTTGPRTR